MASLTIRKLEETLKGRLRMRAAARGRSMEEEARHILRSALNEAPQPAGDLGERIRRRFAPLGDVQLTIAEREPVREPPLVSETPKAPTPSKAPRAARAKRRA